MPPRGDAWSLSMPTLNWVDLMNLNAGEVSPEVAACPHELLDAARQAGFGAIGLDLWTVSQLRQDGLGESLGRGLTTRGLGCSDVGVLELGLGTTRSQAVQLAELARHVRASVCVTAFRAPVTAASLAELDEVAGLLAMAGVRVALEFVPYGFLKTLGAAASLCQSVGWDRCGILLDSWHFFRSGAPWAELVRLTPGSVAFVQINDGLLAADADQVLEGRSKRLLPGCGEFDLARFLKAIQNLGYRGPIGVEVLSSEFRALPLRAAAMALMTSAQSVLSEA